MKNHPTLFCAGLGLALTLTGPAAGADLRLADGRVLREAVVLEIEGGLAVVRHAEAIEGVPVENLPRAARVVVNPAAKPEPARAPAAEWLVGRVAERRTDGWLVVEVRAPFTETRRDLWWWMDSTRQQGLVTNEAEARRIRRELAEWRKMQPRVPGGTVWLRANVRGPEVALRVRPDGTGDGVRRYRAAD